MSAILTIVRHGETSANVDSVWHGSTDTPLGLTVQIDDDLKEFHLGSWEGKAYADLFKVQRLWHHMRRDPDFAPHGGESPRQVVERLTGALQRIARRHTGERVIVVSHGGALSMALAQILDGDYREWGRVMENCAVSELVIEPEPKLLSFNHTDHLEGL